VLVLIDREQELTGDAAADGTLENASPDDRPPLNLPNDDECVGVAPVSACLRSL
jgi:hypothetical protein